MTREHLFTRFRQTCAIVLAVSLCVLLVPPIQEQAHAADELTPEQLAPHIVQGANPANTVVNLFDYSTGKTGTTADLAGTDTVGGTGGASPYKNFETWLTGDGNINKGRLLTFGDGMRHMGYWNQGLVAGYNTGGVSNTDPDAFANANPGMQGIVESVLSESGFPVVSANLETGYNADTKKYSNAQRNNNEMIYGNAGPLWLASLANNTIGNDNFDPVMAWNIGRAVQAQALAVSQGKEFDFTPFNNSSINYTLKSTFENEDDYLGVNWAEGYELPESVRSLQYLFDLETDAAGKVGSYKNVTGLFQMDDEGYYYYNMRKNFAEFVEEEVKDEEGSVVSDGHFVLYDAPAGFRTDGAPSLDNPSIGGFFPFNRAAAAFKLDADGKLVNNLRADNNNNPSEDPGKIATTHPEFKNVEPVNHHLGMTVETSFRQPVDGMVGDNPMVFQFAGDDDVWVFVDDVLVLDMGGIHSEVYGTIDFSTGEVYVGPSYTTGGIPDDPKANAAIKTTLRKQFEAAGQLDVDRWNGDTFASNTSHTLKMFYLERGNYDSSIALRFNLQPAMYQQIYKVDQYGDPAAGAQFELYAARPIDGSTPTIENSSSYTLDQVEPIIGEDGPLTRLVTGEDGVARFEDPTARIRDTSQAEPFNFSDRYDPDTGDGLLYILRETQAPEGYKSLPQDLLLRFEPDYTMLVVNNRYQTGAYSSFVSHITGNPGSVYYGQIGEDGGLVDRIPDTNPVDVEVQRDGLVVVVPMLKEESGGKTEWMSLYGSNLYGFSAIRFDEARESDYETLRYQARMASLRGALMQASVADRAAETGSHANGWYLEWDKGDQRLTGYLENLPGRADRYILQNPETGDMRNFYAVIKPNELAAALEITREQLNAMSSAERYAALGAKVSEALEADGNEWGEHCAKIVNAINPQPDNYEDRGYCPLDIKAFIRDFRSRIYIPNEQRQLRVMKVDQDGNYRNGAVFALYSSYDAAQENDPDKAASVGETASVAGVDGLLLFEPHEGHKEFEDADGHAVPGYADMVWPDKVEGDQAATYWLREVSAPEGCEINPAIIEVKAGIYSIYADAGEEDDGVKVMAGVGKLTQTMVKYASDGDVNITLRDITAFAQHQNSDDFDINGWEDTELPYTGQNVVKRTMDLHYGTNAVVDYGLSDEDGGKNYQPFFVTDSGYIRARVQQNLHAHDDPSDPHYSTAECDDLGDDDITGLFSLINTVVVTDQDKDLPASGTLALSKMVEGDNLSEDDYRRNYHFELRLHDKDGNELTDSFYYYGRNRTGYVKSGDVLPLAHEDEIRILGVPEGTKYSVVEQEANEEGWYTKPRAGKFEGVVAGDTVHRLSFKNVKGVRPPDPDLGIVKDQAVGEGDFTKETLDVNGGDEVTYRLTVTNTGKGLADDVIVVDPLPEGLTYVEGSASDGGVYEDGSITWELGDLAAGASKSVTFKASVPQVDADRSWINGGSVSYFDDDGERTDPLKSNEVVIKAKPSDDPSKPTNPDDPKKPGNPDDPKKPGDSFATEDPGDIEDPTSPKPLPDPKSPSSSDNPGAMVSAGDVVPVAVLCIVTALLAVALVLVGRRAFGGR